MSKKCAICNTKLGLLNTYNAQDGIICFHCSIISKSYHTETINNLKKYWETNKYRFSIFNATSSLKNFMSQTVTIDDNNKLFIIGDCKKSTLEPIVYSFNEVLTYEVQTIGSKVITEKKGGISRAIVGNLVAGPVGAIVGSGTAKEETKTVGGTSVLNIDFLMESGNYRVSIANFPNNFPNFLDKCILEKSKEPTIISSSSSDNITEIKRYKELLDAGIITEDEFLLKKKKLLNL